MEEEWNGKGEGEVGDRQRERGKVIEVWKRVKKGKGNKGGGTVQKGNRLQNTLGERWSGGRKG